MTDTSRIKLQWQEMFRDPPDVFNKTETMHTTYTWSFKPETTRGSKTFYGSAELQTKHKLKEGDEPLEFLESIYFITPTKEKIKDPRNLHLKNNENTFVSETLDGGYFGEEIEGKTEEFKNKILEKILEMCI